ncbi:MAG: hypothetical protein NTW28_21950 [Candidatus Solibacter sp.]|nr:hypothetical protein [Candidatus Solibacter sp.]
MRNLSALTIGFLLSALCLCAQGQTAPGKEAPASESKGMPPRAAPTDYQAHAQAGTVTIAAEFTGHGIATSQGALTTEEYVVVETGFFGAAGARTTLSAEDFSLRINGKKTALSTQPFGLVAGSLKDPEWEPPLETKKSKSSMSGGGGGGGQGESNEPPTPPKMPFPVRRAMEQRVLKATLPEGDRALPVAGLIFFQYRGKTKDIRSLELIYAGPAGKATLTLQP